MAKIDGGLRALFRQHLPAFDWVSIESGSTGGGIPDSNYCHQGAEGWIEFKQTSGHTCPLRAEQVGWILRRVRAGGRVFIALRQRAEAGPRRPARDALWLINGRWAKEAKQFGVRGEWTTVASVHATGCLKVADGGPSSWDWRAIADTLVS